MGVIDRFRSKYYSVLSERVGNFREGHKLELEIARRVLIYTPLGKAADTGFTLLRDGHQILRNIHELRHQKKLTDFPMSDSGDIAAGDNASGDYWGAEASPAKAETPETAVLDNTKQSWLPTNTEENVLSEGDPVTEPHRDVRSPKSQNDAPEGDHGSGVGEDIIGKPSSADVPSRILPLAHEDTTDISVTRGEHLSTSPTQSGNDVPVAVVAQNAVELGQSRETDGRFEIGTGRLVRDSSAGDRVDGGGSPLNIASGTVSDISNEKNSLTVRGSSAATDLSDAEIAAETSDLAVYGGDSVSTGQQAGEIRDSSSGEVMVSDSPVEATENGAIEASDYDEFSQSSRNSSEGESQATDSLKSGSADNDIASDTASDTSSVASSSGYKDDLEDGNC